MTKVSFSKLWSFERNFIFNRKQTKYMTQTFRIFESFKTIITKYIRLSKTVLVIKLLLIYNVVKQTVIESNNSFMFFLNTH